MRLPGDLDGDRFLRAMGRLGWIVVRQRGSHRRIRHEATGQEITVAFHKVIPRAAVRRTLRQAGIAESAFLAAL